VPAQETSVRLSEKVIVVTGAARGLGQRYALRLAAEGATVVAADARSCADTVAQAPMSFGSVVAEPVDVSSEADTAALAERVVARYGRIDVLVNNAAVYGGLEPRPFHQLSVEDWDRVMAVNVRGTWLCTKAVYRYMKAAGRGRIINVASNIYLTGVPHLAHYSASKAAVAGLTYALARELGADGISIVALAPGLTLSEASTDMIAPSYVERTARQVALRRNALPEDLEGVVAFLASDESSFMSGTVVTVDGGLAYR
jgi:NAD(P)-dependent dehydrogenase (short-subunit alcohol dehydrogenase family)